MFIKSQKFKDMKYRRCKLSPYMLRLLRSTFNITKMPRTSYGKLKTKKAECNVAEDFKNQSEKPFGANKRYKVRCKHELLACYFYFCCKEGARAALRSKK